MTHPATAHIRDPDERTSRASAIRSELARRARLAASAPTSKRCPRCDTVKVLEDFHANASRPDGLHVWCRACR